MPLSPRGIGALSVGQWESSQSCRVGRAVQVSHSRYVSGTVAIRKRKLLTPPCTGKAVSSLSRMSQNTVTSAEELKADRVTQKIFPNSQINGRENSWACWYSPCNRVSKKVKPHSYPFLITSWPPPLWGNSHKWFWTSFSNGVAFMQWWTNNYTSVHLCVTLLSSFTCEISPLSSWETTKFSSPPEEIKSGAWLKRDA